eukprot:885745-Prymnesium_polylepis.1
MPSECFPSTRASGRILVVKWEVLRVSRVRAQKTNVKRPSFEFTHALIAASRQSYGCGIRPRPTWEIRGAKKNLYGIRPFLRSFWNTVEYD